MLVAFRPTSVLVDSSATKRGAYRPGPVKRLKHFFVCSAILIVIAFFVLFVNDKRFAKRMAILVSPADGGILARGKMATTVTAEEEIELLKASEGEENVQPGAGNVQLTAVNDVTQRTLTSVYNRRLWGGEGWRVVKIVLNVYGIAIWEKYRRFCRVRMHLTRQSSAQLVEYAQHRRAVAIWRLPWLENTYLKKILYTDN